MDGFSRKEISALYEFRQRVADVLPDDPFKRRDDSLIRWIRARELDLDKAETMFRNSMKWRRSNNIDKILDDPIDYELVDRFPYYMDGVDKRGRPVLTFQFGRWDLRSFIEKEGTVRFDHHANQLLETVTKNLMERTLCIEDANGTTGCQSTCLQLLSIIDMSGYSYWQLANLKAIQALIQTISVYEAHYPEILGQSIVINAPAIFSILYGLTKPFMSARTIQKIKVFSSNKNQWHPAVMQLVDKDQIREQFGGTKK